MRKTISFYLSILGMLLVSFSISAQTTFPYVIKNNTKFADSELYVAVVGEDLTSVPGNHIWIDCKTSQVKMMDRGYNTVQGPVYGGDKGPGGNAMYADCFTKLSDIPNKTINLPGIQGCRVFISVKSQLYFYFFGANGSPRGYTAPSFTNTADPNQGILYEMIELTNDKWGFFGNTTRVDSYKYPMGLELFGADGYHKIVGDLLSHEEIGAKFQAFAPKEFKNCYNPENGEIMAPSKTKEFADGTIGTMPTPGPYVNYFKPYIDKIWDKYSKEDLIFDSGDAGIWKGRISGETLTLNCIAGGYKGRTGVIARKPTTQEAMEGKGALDMAVQDPNIDRLVQAQLCAAINRSVVDVSTPNVGQQDWSDHSTYHKAELTNYYVKFWHEPGICLDRKAYGFAYDDVWNYSPSLHTPKPTKAIMIFGGLKGTDVLSATITSPANNAKFTLPTSITVSANVTASNVDVTVSKVEFFAGTTLIGTDNTAPYSITWSNPTVGDIPLTAKVTDSNGNSATSPVVNISVTDPNGPTVSITSPKTGSKVTAPANITISADASTGVGSISEVKFYNGTTLLGTDTSAPYSFAWTNVAAGSYTLTATTKDSNGKEATSAPVSVTVEKKIDGCSGEASNGDYAYQITTAEGKLTWTFEPLAPIAGSTMSIIYINGAGYMMTPSGTNFTFTKEYPVGQSLTFHFTYRVGNTGVERNSSANPHKFIVGDCGDGSRNVKPTVSITAPADGSKSKAPATIEITAEAADSDGTVAKVEFFQGTTKLGEDLSSPYSLTWSNVAAGNYSITAKATDDAGATTTSTAVAVTVEGDGGGGCSGTASNGDYSYAASTGADGKVTFTFTPLAPIAGCNMSIIYVNGIGYTMAASGTKFTFTNPFAAGTNLNFYFTYRVGTTGMERNSSANPHKYVVGSDCSSTRFISDNESLNRATVHPNPVVNVLHLGNIAEKSEVVVKSLNGIQVLKTTLSGNSIDLSNLQKGVYILQIKSGGKVINKRIIKN